MRKRKKQFRTQGRVIGLDLHPDIFSTCILKGTTNAEARVFKREKDLPVSSLRAWAKRTLRAGDLVVLEAGTNSFEIVRQLEALGHCACVLDSHQVGKVADSYIDDDLKAAERIARCYLTGMTKTVWVPDAVTSQRRELLHAYLKATEAETRAVNQLRGLLTQYQIRLEKRNPRCEKTHAWVLEQRDWSPLQQSLLEHHFENLSFAQRQAGALYATICHEVLRVEPMSACLRVLGIGPINAFAAVATVGDINRFVTPEKLVNYLGLHPGRRQSGKGKDYKPGVGHRGRKEMRTLLVQAANAVMRQAAGANDLRDWGWRLFARKGVRNVATAAVARKLAIQLWHLMQGGCVTKEEQKRPLKTKVARLFRQLDIPTRIQLGFEEKVSDCVAQFMKQIDIPTPRTI